MRLATSRVRAGDPGAQGRSRHSSGTQPGRTARPLRSGNGHRIPLLHGGRGCGRASRGTFAGAPGRPERPADRSAGPDRGGEKHLAAGGAAGNHPCPPASRRNGQDPQQGLPGRIWRQARFPTDDRSPHALRWSGCKPHAPHGRLPLRGPSSSSGTQQHLRELSGATDSNPLHLSFPGMVRWTKYLSRPRKNHKIGMDANVRPAGGLSSRNRRIPRLP